MLPFSKKAPPLSLWAVTLILAASLFMIAVFLDQRHAKSNPAIDLVARKINNYSQTRAAKQARKPLVVGIGNSLLMMSTPYDWQPAEFYWLRLVIQGGKVRDFALVSDQIAALEPDLVVIGLNTLRADSLPVRTRRSVKRLARRPFEMLGMLAQNARYEQDRSGCSVWSQQRVTQRISKQFESIENDLENTKLLQTLIEQNIPVAVFQEPILAQLEDSLDSRQRWLEKFDRDALRNQLAVHRMGRSFDKSYFCEDLMHMSNKGVADFTPWLKSLVVDLLVNDK